MGKCSSSSLKLMQLRIEGCFSWVLCKLRGLNIFLHLNEWYWTGVQQKFVFETTRQWGERRQVSNSCNMYCMLVILVTRLNCMVINVHTVSEHLWNIILHLQQVPCVYLAERALVGPFFCSRMFWWVYFMASLLYLTTNYVVFCVC